MNSLKEAILIGVGSNLNVLPRRRRRRSNNDNIDRYFYRVGGHFWQAMNRVYRTTDKASQREIKNQIEQACPKEQSKIIVQKLTKTPGI